MVSIRNHSAESIPIGNILGSEKCEEYLVFQGETALGDGFRAFLYCLGLAYCFIGLSAITARFFRSMETVVKHSRTVVEIDPLTNCEVVRHEKVWNYTIADITLLAFGTSFPQISLATIDAIRNLGQLYAGGLFLFILALPLLIGYSNIEMKFAYVQTAICKIGAYVVELLGIAIVLLKIMLHGLCSSL